jgi:hypothetical protein
VKEKFITTAELANGASKVLAGLKRGTGTVILRYSDPVGVLISWDDYKKIENLEIQQVKECKSCISNTKGIIQNTKRKV